MNVCWPQALGSAIGVIPVAIFYYRWGYREGKKSHD